MRQVAALVAAFACLAAGSAAQAASPQFALFQKYCVSTNSMAAVALAAAKADGYTAMPEDTVKSLAAQQGLTGASALTKQDGDNVLVLIVGAKPNFNNQADTKADTCSLVVTQKGVDFDQELATWVGLAPVATQGPITLYMYNKGPRDERQAVPADSDKAALAALVKSETLRMVGLYHADFGQLLVYMTIRPS